MSCIIGTNLIFRDFQGHVLDLASSTNPVTSFTRNIPPSPNQAWNIHPLFGNWGVATHVGLNPTTIQWISYDVSTGSPLNKQAIVTLNQTNALGFVVNCLNSTAATLTIGSPTGNALTAWQAQTGSSVSPITFQALTGRNEQAWGLESLD
ncbi:hypothetical protein B0H11DRAFT_2008882 [Mycena galericulata]|nr:hypothetical protein B0H11DRAFT_2008882 [Mycena galericulata]